MERIKFWKRDEEGATAVEYGIMVALIAIVIIGAVLALGNSLDETFTEVGNCLDAPEGCPGEGEGEGEGEN